MLDNILFYIVFISQVFFISFYYPRKILNRIDFVFKNYPQSEYPRLYVKSIDSFKRKQQSFKMANQLIIVIGILLVFAIVIWDYLNEGYIDQIIPWIYFMLQALPLMLLEYSCFAYFKLMRKADSRNTRKAELNPRKLFSFVSPLAVGFALFLISACILIFYSMHQFQFHPSNDTFIISTTLIASNLLFGGIIYWNLYGKKINPYQATKDRLNQIEVTIKSLVFMSIAASLFLIITGIVENYNLDYLESTLMSIYLQLIIFIGLGSILKGFRVENIDFEVYKENI